MLGEVATSHIQRRDVGTSTGTPLRLTPQGTYEQECEHSIISGIRSTGTSTQSAPQWFVKCLSKAFVN